MLLISETEDRENECSSCSLKHSDFTVKVYNSEKDINIQFHLCKKCVRELRELREYLNTLNNLDKLR